MKTKHYGLAFVLAGALLLAGCGSTPTPTTVVATIPATQATTATVNPATSLPSPTPNLSYGLTITVAKACFSGSATTLTLITKADLAYWGLLPTDFEPIGQGNLETAIVFMENGQLFSGISGGGRDGTSFDPLQGAMAVQQHWTFPKAPTPGAQYSVTKAEITLGGLPPHYRAPVGLPPTAWIDPTTLRVTAQANLPVAIGLCQ